jgi:hypothetical protein
MAVACPFVLRYEDRGTLQEAGSGFSQGPEASRGIEYAHENGFPVEPSESWYRSVGECYIQNMMNGEVFKHLNERTDDWDLGGKLFQIR